MFALAMSSAAREGETGAHACMKASVSPPLAIGRSPRVRRSEAEPNAHCGQNSGFSPVCPLHPIQRSHHMKLLKEIPSSFWGLFRSPNREIYIEALLKISEEYQYSNYFLSREMCIQVLGDYFSRRQVEIEREQEEAEADTLEPPATRILNWLIRTRWLRRQEDFVNLSVNIVIPDYAAIFIGAFERLIGEEGDEADIYIQNIYANLFSYRNDPRASIALLNTALVNTRRLNKTLQDMLHNMDKFFTSLLDQKFYGELLREHLDGYVEEIVKKKYHILKTSDNFYLYKADIKQWLKLLREEPEYLELTIRRGGKKLELSEAVRLIDDIERGFDDIERRIANMDREHTRYVRVTVSRLCYLLNKEEDTKGLILQLLNRMSREEDPEPLIRKTAARMNLSRRELLSDKSLYRKRKPREVFREKLQPEEAAKELSREELLSLNRVSAKYTREQITDFIRARMKDKTAVITGDSIRSEEDFEKLILAYDYSLKKESPFRTEGEPEFIDNGAYVFPALVFREKPEAGERRRYTGEETKGSYHTGKGQIREDDTIF